MSSRSVINSPKPVSNCEHALYLESSLLQLRDTGLMSDVTIVCGSQTFKAHKIILVASSGYFYNIFTNKLKKDVKHLAMTDITPEILKIILDYIYTGLLNVNRFMKINQDALIRALHHLDMADVYQHRLRLMMKSLAPNYYSELWSLADLYQMKDMSIEIAKYIAQNLELCMNNRHFINLTLPQLVAVLSSDYLKTQAESMTLEAIQKWVLHDISTRERYAMSLLTVAKVTVSAKTKAIAFYDGELQNFLLAPNKKKSCSPNCKRDRAKKVPSKDFSRTSQVSISSFRSDKNDKVIRTWKKKPMKLDEPCLNELPGSPKSFDYNLQQGDFLLGGESDNETVIDGNCLNHITPSKLDAERDTETQDTEIQVNSPFNNPDEARGNGDKKINTPGVDYISNNLNNEYLKPKLLPSTAVASDLLKTFKKPVRVYSIQIDSDPPRNNTDAGHEEINQFSEERIQIMKLKSKLNLIINRIRCTLQKNTVSQYPVTPMSEDGSSVCSKRSNATYTDGEYARGTSTSEEFAAGNYPQLSPLISSPGSMKSRTISNVLPIENDTGNSSIDMNVSDESPDVKLCLNLEMPIRTEKNQLNDTFRASENQMDDTNVRYYNSPQETSGSKNCDDKGSSVVLKRPIATSNESLISPEEVRCRLEKFKRLMHTKCSNPVDVEKINLKGSRSFIISGTDVDPLDAISDHCDFLSDISEADTMIDSSSTEDGLLETQTEWFRTLSTIPEETSICDFNGSSSIELRSVKSDSPLKFGERCKPSWNIKERDSYEHTIENANYLSNSGLNDLDKSLPDNIFSYELGSDANSQLFDEDILSNNMQQQQLMNNDSTDYLTNVTSNVHSSRQKGFRSSTDSLSIVNENENENAEINDDQCWNSDKMKSAEELSDSAPRYGSNSGLPKELLTLCKLKVSEDSDNKIGNHNSNYVMDSTKSIAGKSISDDYETFENLSLGELKVNEITNVFEYGGYQCFAERSSNHDEMEAPTARSSDTLNITLENFVTPSHNKMKSMPIANDIWKMWKTKLEACCKPSPRPNVKFTDYSYQPDPKTASSFTPNVSDTLTVDEQIETLNCTMQSENDDLRNALQRRIFSAPKTKMIKQINSSSSPTSGSSPELSVQVSPFSAVMASANQFSSSELTIEDDLQTPSALREGSTSIIFPVLELTDLNLKERDTNIYTARTQILSSTYPSRNFAHLSECPLQEIPTEKVQYVQSKIETNYPSSTPSTGLSRDRSSSVYEDSNFESPSLKVGSLKESRSCQDDGPLLILLATNKHNEASQQVYCLRKRCWLAQRQLLMPPIENNYSVGYFEGNVYYIGGLLNGSFRKTNSVFIYRSREHMLVPASDLLVARVGAGVANLNKKIYVAGGIGRYHKPIAQVERYDTKADRWHLVAALRIARTNVCLVTSGKLLFAIGGTVSADSVHEVVSKACESYDSEIDQWSLLVELPSHFLMTNPLVTSVDNKLYAVRISKPDIVFRFHTRKNKWLPIQNTKLTASKVCCILPGERKLYAVELAGKTIHSFDMHAFQWEVETHFPAGLHWQAAAFVTGLLDENE